MEHPFKEKLRINLDTDIKVADNWYDAKWIKIIFN